jgi:hypothetical protein
MALSNTLAATYRGSEGSPKGTLREISFTGEQGSEAAARDGKQPRMDANRHE